MYEKGIHVVVCPESRCSVCPSKSASLYCASFSSDITEGKKILLIEMKRNLVHLSESSVDVVFQPPWSGGLWTTVYIDSISVIENEIDRIIDSYVTGPYLSLFLRDSKSNQLMYYGFPCVKSSLEHSLLRNLVHDTKNDFFDGTPTRIPIQRKVTLIADSIEHHIASSLPEIDKYTRKNLSQIVSHRSTVLGPLFSILMDDDVEEIYLDAPDTYFYFDHGRLGRIQTNLKPTSEELTRIVTFLRSESNLHLDRRNPSLKTDLLIDNTPLRFSVSLPPLASEGIHLEIRRAKNRPFTILDLIRNGTLTVDAAAMLILAINSRMNITITGSPGVGKTTLMNALDSITPSYWRKLYIEDTIESRRYEGHHQIRVRVDPIDETSGSFDKVTEIVKSLHRSPDYLILGEIQTEEHSKALFQSLAAGLSSIQTCHSASPSGLITRWIKNHGIDKSSIALMDLIVSLNRPKPGESARYVDKIVEIRRITESGVVLFDGLNILYDKMNPSLFGNWTENGAFHQSSLKHGTDSHVPALHFISEELKKQVMDNDGTLSNIEHFLWSNGHPMSVSKI